MVEVGVQGKASASPTGTLSSSSFDSVSCDATALPKEPQPNMCPECGSSNINQNGKRQLDDGSEVQRFKCKTCGYRFSDTNNLKSYSNYYRRSQQNMASGGLELLAAQPEIKTVCAGEVGKAQLELKGKILQYELFLKNKAKSPETIRTYISALVTLSNKGANLLDPADVEHVIAQQDTWSIRAKKNFVDWYARFCKYLKIVWEKPTYKAQDKKVFYPPELMIDQLIAGTTKKVSIAVAIGKETAARIGEVVRIKWKDVDTDNNILHINYPEKGSNTGSYKISTTLMMRINTLPKVNDRIFGNSSADSIANLLLTARKKIATNLNEPRFLDLHFHILRHWKLTRVAIDTKSPYMVQSVGRHKDIRMSQKYVDLAATIAASKEPGLWEVRPVHSLQEAIELGQIGFMPYLIYEGVQLVRKPL